MKYQHTQNLKFKQTNKNIIAYLNEYLRWSTALQTRHYRLLEESHQTFHHPDQKQGYSSRHPFCPIHKQWLQQF